MDNDTPQPETEGLEPSPAVSGLDLLRSAFAAPPPADGDGGESTPPESTGDATGGTPPADTGGDTTGAPAKAPAEWGDEDLGKVLQDPRVVTQLRQLISQRDAQIRAQFLAEQQAERLREEEALLTDEDIGQRVRENQRLAPMLTQAQAAGYARAQQDMLQLGVNDVFSKVPELKDLAPAERVALDPVNPRFTSMGDYFAALVDAAASKRAEKLAQKQARELAAAMVKDRTAQNRQAAPGLQGPAGQGRDVATFVDVDKMSGREILTRAFAR